MEKFIEAYLIVNNNNPAANEYSLDEQKVPDIDEQLILLITKSLLLDGHNVVGILLDISQIFHKCQYYSHLQEECKRHCISLINCGRETEEVKALVTPILQTASTASSTNNAICSFDSIEIIFMAFDRNQKEILAHPALQTILFHLLDHFRIFRN